MIQENILNGEFVGLLNGVHINWYSQKPLEIFDVVASKPFLYVTALFRV
jgi:hypothetical protein